MAVVRSIVAICVLLALFRLVAGSPNHTGRDSFSSGLFSQWFGPDRVGTNRDRVERALEQLPGEQLAVVRYAPDHFSGIDWVYNAAEIDKSKVIWAREMDTASNQELFKYYRNRKVWLVQPDSPDSVLSPYPMN